MKTALRTLTTLSAALLASVSSLLATPTFSVANGGISLTGQSIATTGLSAATAWTVNETMTSAGTLALIDTDGNPLVTPFPTLQNNGIWLTKTVVNNSGAEWTSFELELQEILGTASSNNDGLSFAQGAGLTFTSSAFSTVTRLEATRDYLNFSGGNVAPGQSVSFTFAITDTLSAAQSTIYLLQTPNKEDGNRVPDHGSTALLLTAGLAGLVGLRRKLG